MNAMTCCLFTENASNSFQELKVKITYTGYLADVFLNWQLTIQEVVNTENGTDDAIPDDMQCEVNVCYLIQQAWVLTQMTSVSTDLTADVWMNHNALHGVSGIGIKQKQSSGGGAKPRVHGGQLQSFQSIDCYTVHVTRIIHEQHLEIKMFYVESNWQPWSWKFTVNLLCLLSWLEHSKTWHSSIGRSQLVDMVGTQFCCL